MKREISAACLCAALFAGVLPLAQAAKQTPKASPELKSQDFFVGTWSLQGSTTFSPFGPGGQQFKSSEHLEWMPGGMFLFVQSYEASGKLAGITIIGYDVKEKVFTHTTYKSNGEIELAKGTAETDRWIWTADATVAGKSVKDRFTINKTSSSTYSWVDEMKPAEGSTWSRVAEGTGTKTG